MKSILVLFLTLTLVAAACSSDDASTTNGEVDGSATTAAPDNATGSSNTATTTEDTELISDDATQPLDIQLNQGQAATQIEGPADEPAPIVQGEPIDEIEIEEIIDRLPELIDDPENEEDFNRPPETLRPPTSGRTIDQEFPADGGDPPPEVSTGPLEVLRFQPEGQVPLAPYLSVTFNQAMVPLGTLGQLDVDDVPVTFTPEIPGHWEWIGTRTLRFESDSDEFDRLPMATNYSVTVLSGATSQAGKALANDVTWTFSTPTPTVRSLSPQGNSLPLNPVFTVRFDQQVDPEAALATISLTADRDNQPLRLATDAEVEADAHASRVTLDERSFAFTPSVALPTDAELEIRVGPGVPSTEGPLTTGAEESFSARTYAPLQVRDQNCRNDECQPLSGFFVQMNNALDEERFDESMVTVDPAIPGMTINANGSSISIRGATAGDTTYKVTLRADLTDIYGQTLGDDEELDFRVGDADPYLGAFDGRLVVVDPLADNPTLTVPLINHDQVRIRVYEVDPSDWELFSSFRNAIHQNREDQPEPIPPGSEIANTTIDTNAEDDELTLLDIGLGEYLNDGTGQIVVVVEPTGELADLEPGDDHYWNNRPTTTWAQATNIGLDAYSDGREIVVWTTALDSGDPLAGVTVELEGNTGRITEMLTTGPDGTARATLTGDIERLVARVGDDIMWLTPGINKPNFQDQIRWYIVDDRGIYRPGETVRVKGWVRNLTLSTNSQIELLDTGTTINWSAQDPQGSEIGTGTADISPLGGFDIELELPAGSNLGNAWITFALPGVANAQGGHNFQIQEFRRPEFEVSARTETAEPHFINEPATVAVEANYFSGGPLPDATVDWTVTTRSTTYRPPNWNDYTFGRWIPWWYAFDDTGDFCCGGFDQGDVQQLSGTTDATGTHYLEIGFGDATQDGPSTVTANAAVMDVNRQVWSADTSLLVHSGELYVGLASEKTFVRRGDKLEINAIVTDLDGNTVNDRSVDVLAEVLEWRKVDGEWGQVAVNSQTCPISSSAEPELCTFETEFGGRYRISAVVTDDDGGQNRTEITRWISGGKGRPSSRVERESAELVPDQENYQPGDTAEILVQSPFGPAEGLLMVTRNGFLETTRFAIDEDTTVLTVPIEDSHIPGVNVRVELTGTAPRLDDDGQPIAGADPRPAYAGGQLTLRVPPISRTLTVDAVPQSDAVEPGAETSVDVTVRNAAGDPVEDAELLLVVVDEAVLALSGYELTDPIETFYQPFGSSVQTDQTRRLIRLTKPDLDLLAQTNIDAAVPTAASAEIAEASEAMSEDAADSAAIGARQKSGADGIEVRSNFDALAVFEPELTTGADGTATMTFTMPDNLTRYRVMVVAVADDDEFGSGESTITARLPLQVRPSAPRFLNFGDAFDLPVLVQNQTDEDMVVDVVIEATNLDLTNGAGQRVTVPANNRVEVRFPAAANEAGTATFRVAAVSGDNTDAATISLPVYTPATSEAFATYGVVDDGAVFQPVLGPEAVWPQFGGLEINTSSTALQALTDAVIYVNEYRYASSDAAASRILSISSLRDVMGAFDAEGMPTEAEMDASVRTAIDTIVGLQNGDGGFPYWSRNRESVPYNTVHVFHALVIARQAGFDVPGPTFRRALQYIENIEQFYPDSYSAVSQDTISAYALHVRALRNDRDTAKAEALVNSPAGELSLDALAWLYPVVDNAGIRAEIDRTFGNRTTETAAGATFVNNYSDDDYVLLHSNRRTDGIVLNALITENPDSDLIPKVVEGLLAGKTKGRWGNLQENTFILVALHNYFETFEDVEPDFVARVWLGDTYVAEHTYEGRTTDQNQTVVPMSFLIDEGDDHIVVDKVGDGRLYYRLGLDYAPEDLTLDPLDRGFVVQRTYEAVNDPDDVWRDDDGVWHVKAGAEVRVRLTMTADSRRTHVALVDPLPAGLEILNPALAPTETLTRDEGQTSGWWWWQWFNHQNLRDDRAEAFTNYLWAGTYDYSYIARATTPGTFVVPPTKAEEMYHPETFGRASTDTLIVES